MQVAESLQDGLTDSRMQTARKEAELAAIRMRVAELEDILERSKEQIAKMAEMLKEEVEARDEQAKELKETKVHNSACFAPAISSNPFPPLFHGTFPSSLNAMADVYFWLLFQV